MPVYDSIPSFHALAVHSLDEKQPYSDWFETTYVGKLGCGRRLLVIAIGSSWKMEYECSCSVESTNNQYHLGKMAQPHCIYHGHADISKFTKELKEDNSLN